MPKGSPELTAARKEEIMDACRRLYRTMNFKEITLREIGKETSFTRTSIYNYFQTKEEIFLALFEKEYSAWTKDLLLILKNESLSRDQLAKEIALSLGKRELMLKILAVNLYDLEENSRIELLVDFKKEYAASLDAMNRILKKYCSDLDEEERRKLLLSIFMFFHGLYPYAFHTKKQTDAMEKAGVDIVDSTVYELALAGLERLLV